MPHRVGGKWKWGNLERSDKEELRRIVYGIWKKNGEKGSFSSFWKTGRVDESGLLPIEPTELEKRILEALRQSPPEKPSAMWKINYQRLLCKLLLLDRRGELSTDGRKAALNMARRLRTARQCSSS